MATLRRIKPNDQAGDSGARVEAIKWKKDGTLDKIVANEPTVGCSLLVGSVTARTYSGQDYWLTTEITEILEDTKKKDGRYIRFKTGNSEYEFIE